MPGRELPCGNWSDPGWNPQSASTISACLSGVSTECIYPRQRLIQAVITALLAFLALLLAAGPALAQPEIALGLPGKAVSQVEPAPEGSGSEVARGEAESSAYPAEARLAVLHRQGAQAAASLARVAPVSVENPFPVPERNGPVQSALVEEPGRGVISDSTMPDAAHSVRHVISARKHLAADVAQGVRATLGIIARGAAATTTPDPTAPATPAAPVAGASISPGRLSLLTLLSMLVAVLITRIWHMHREPFVLKVKPVKA